MICMIRFDLNELQATSYAENQREEESFPFSMPRLRTHDLP